jgi:hypothetical protein
MSKETIQTRYDTHYIRKDREAVVFQIQVSKTRQKGERHREGCKPIITQSNPEWPKEMSERSPDRVWGIIPEN